MNKLAEIANKEAVERTLRSIEDYAERVQPPRGLGLYRMWEFHKEGYRRLVAYYNSKPNKPAYIVVKNLSAEMEEFLESICSMNLVEGSYQFYNTSYAWRSSKVGRGLRIRVR